MLTQITIEELENLNKKINSAFILHSKGTFSIIDKDILLSNIRKLYELVGQLETDNINDINIPVEKISTIEKAIEIDETPLSQIKKDSIENIEEIERSDDNQIEKLKPTFDDLVNKVKEQMTHQSKPQDFVPVLESSEKEKPIYFSDFNIEELFSSTTPNELSDRLSQSHIDDIAKSMGLNERIFTLNELFGGNNNEFENSIQELNNAGSFEQAKFIITTKLASKYDWLQESKIKKAKDFIKLVRRRFI